MMRDKHAQVVGKLSRRQFAYGQNGVRGVLRTAFTSFGHQFSGLALILWITPDVP